MMPPGVFVYVFFKKYNNVNIKIFIKTLTFFIGPLEQFFNN